MTVATIDIVKDADTLSEGARSRLSEYLSGFHAPAYKENAGGERTGIACPACDSRVYSGDILDALLPGFEWGIAHGDGFCISCKWPIRMYHFIKLDDEDEQRFVFPLAYRCFKDDDRKNEIDPAKRQKRQS
jgi:hypothetical protein